MTGQMDWQVLVPSRNTQHRVKGTELEMAVMPGQSRFAIYAVRRIAADGELDIGYRIRDAEQVTDAELASGMRPPVVFEGDWDECLGYCQGFQGDA